MTLTPGTRFGVYEILSALGAGGMGEVYRARDTKLKRDVALKILPEQFTADRERLARFQREAEVLASLNHPNIAAIYGFDDSAAIRFLVMELVEGETLANHVQPVPVAEALSIARQVAEALQSAHELGIIHRDLKPANIKLRSDGSVKVLDFGLAKTLEPAVAARADPSMSPTITTPAMTQLGMILGTAAYMSPEQARGLPADKRSDVWAFGCVLYEMLAGRRAFEGEDVADTLANVLKVDPDWRALPADVPPAIRTLITRCLAKDRRQRISDMSVAQFILGEQASLAPLQPQSPPAAIAAPPKPRWRATIAVAVGVLLTALLVSVGVWRSRPASPAAAVARFSITVPEGEQFTNRHVIALSPDGKHLAYVGNNRLFLRSVSEFDAHAIPGTDGDGTITNPAFSPDGLSIAFHVPRSNTVKRIAISGGASVTVCAAAPPFGMTWDSSGILVGQAGRGIVRCSPNGGAPEQLAIVNEGEIAHGPQLLVDGTMLLFTIAKIADGPARWDKAHIVVQSMTTKARQTVVEGGTDARYLPTGHLVYALGGTVYAVPFDASRRQATGGAVPVIEGVRRPAAGTGAAQFATSTNGSLVYLPGPVGMATTDRALAVADRTGAMTRLPLAPGPYVYVRASRDGARLAIGSDDGKEAIVWIDELAGGRAMRRLTFGGQNRFPIWSPDGQRVAFQSDRERDSGIFSQRADGNGPAERLTKAATGEVHVPESWSPDGRYMSFSVLKGVALSLWVLSIADGKAMPYGDVQSAEPIGSVFSPDGRWVAYSSTPTPTAGAGVLPNRGVYIQPFPATGAYYQVPKSQPQQLDFHPVWGPKGAELFYVPSAASGHLAAVSITTQPNVVFGTPATLQARVTASRLSTETRAYDILPDGRFVGLVGASETEPFPIASSGQLRVVLNWFEELKQRVP